MAFTGFHVTPGYVGGDGAGSGKGNIFFPTGTSVAPTTGTVTPVSVGFSSSNLQPAIEVYAAEDSYLSIGTAPDASADTENNPRVLVQATTKEWY
jgi:hypothetical protein